MNSKEIKRPDIASDALTLLESGEEIEMETQYVFAFMKTCENHKMKSIKFKTEINKYNLGFTAIKL